MAFMKRGAVYCSNCNRGVIPQRRTKKEISCPLCGHPNMYVRLKWEGKTYRLYVNKDGQTHNYSDAVSDLVTINQEIEDGTFDPDDWLPQSRGDKLFSNQVAVWLERKEMDMDKDKLAPSTLGNYKSYDRVYFSKVKIDGKGTTLYQLDVRDIRMKHLQLFYDKLQGSPKTRKNIMDTLHTFFRWLKRWGEIDEVPVWPEIEAPIQHEQFTLMEDEQIDVLSRIPLQHRDIFEFLMETGLRPTEACALMWIDINSQLRKALIRRTYSEAVLREKTKQKKEQWVVLTDRAWELVMRNAGKTGFVFTNPDTKRGYKYKVLYRLWSKTGVTVGLYNGTRHSLGTQLGNAGIPIQDIAKILRHSDMRTTRRYVHTSDERTREILSTRGKVIEMRKERDK